jgi:hypothetical protein
MLRMTCAEKKELQEHCTAACDAVESATQELRSVSGVWIDWRNKAFMREVPNVARVDHTAEFAKLQKALVKYQSASRALSRHLSTHRC